MSKICKNLSFNDCELAIARQAVDKIDAKIGRQIVQSPEIKQIINIVEQFLKAKKCLCYGGTAINNILPKYDQFYNKDIEIPDYDFFSDNALNYAKELADIYASKGFNEVEAKAGMHHGTYKVFVNFIPVADITYIPSELYKILHKDSIKISGIYYVPANYLRMSMYLELSRPEGDVSRWEKVLKRLILLNKTYPLKGIKCSELNFQRKMEDDKNNKLIYTTVLNTFIDQSAVFFGGYAINWYSKYMLKKEKHQLKEIPDFDVLFEEPEILAEILKENLKNVGLNKIIVRKHKAIGELVPINYEIIVNKETIAFIYKPIACHSYNIVHKNNIPIRIATIDTLLSLYLAFTYVDEPYYDKNRILCMCEYLFNVQAQNRLSQKGLLKRFTMSCIGKQVKKEDIRSEKNNKYAELKNKPNSKEYQEWFLKYTPVTKQTEKESPKNDEKAEKCRKTVKHTKTQNKTHKNKTHKNKTQKNKTQKTKNIFDIF